MKLFATIFFAALLAGGLLLGVNIFREQRAVAEQRAEMERTNEIQRKKALLLRDELQAKAAKAREAAAAIEQEAKWKNEIAEREASRERANFSVIAKIELLESTMQISSGRTDPREKTAMTTIANALLKNLESPDINPELKTHGQAVLAKLAKDFH